MHHLRSPQAHIGIAKAPLYGCAAGSRAGALQPSVRHRRAVHPQYGNPGEARGAVRNDVRARDCRGAQPSQAAARRAVGRDESKHRRTAAQRTSLSGGLDHTRVTPTPALVGQGAAGEGNANPVHRTIGRSQQPIGETTARHDTLAVHQYQTIGALAAERALQIPAIHGLGPPRAKTALEKTDANVSVHSPGVDEDPQLCVARHRPATSASEVHHRASP
jgi:hypothetical protein